VLLNSPSAFTSKNFAESAQLLDAARQQLQTPLDNAGDLVRQMLAKQNIMLFES
jgi:hypothetical protein